jgi:hypothetical protein
VKIVFGLGYQQDLVLARAVARAVDQGLGQVRYFDSDGLEVGRHAALPNYVEEDFSGFFIEDFRVYFPKPTYVARMDLVTSAGSVTWKLDDCGASHWDHPDHVHEVKPCTVLKLSMRYGYDAEATTPPLRTAD